MEESDINHSLITENANDLIILTNEKYEAEYVNERALKQLLGYSKEEIIGVSGLKFIHSDDIQNTLLSIKKGIEESQGVTEIRFRHKNDHYVWMEATGKTFSDDIGGLKAIIILRDITQRILLKQKLKESEEKYRLITENIQDLIVMLNDRFKIEYTNTNALFSMLGYSNKDFVGKRGLKFIYSEDQQKVLKDFIDFSEKGRGSTIARLIHKQGQIIWTETNSSKFIDQDGMEKTLIVIRDISERKEAEEKLVESEKKYRNAYEQVDFFKNLFAHDILNILSVINGSSQLCSLFIEDPEKTKRVKENLDRIRDQVIRAKILIKNVQGMSEIADNKPLIKSIDICISLTKCIKYIKESYEEKSVEISINSSNKRFFVSGNDLILEVFENLLINAIKHNQNSIKKITINVSKEERDGVQFLRMDFIDNGIGITDERKEIIFQKEHKKDKYSNGMGIGLTLVKTIIDSYNGFIWVKDKVPGDYSKGSNFIILIPLTSPEN